MSLLGKLFSKKKTKKASAKAARPKKTTLRKPKKALKKKPAKKTQKEILVGVATHYFPKVKAAVIKLKKAGIASGDTIHIKGATTDFSQKITSIQIDHVPVQKAKKGAEIGLLVKTRVREHDSVYKLS